MQDGGIVWHREDIDGTPDMVVVSVPALEMDRWKTAAASKNVPDRCDLVPVLWRG